MMKLNKWLRRYYKDQIESLQTLDPPLVGQRSHAQIPSKKRVVQWDDILGIIVTAAYILQFLIPTTWFSWGRCLSIFTLGF
ncbi:hypothetical protein JW824_09770 [bacterium]|nr:hypothetical protein [bacterium]RQV94374.1 MAG: hypothetical protein EH221_07965 [bacterium]